MRTYCYIDKDGDPELMGRRFTEVFKNISINIIKTHFESCYNHAAGKTYYTICIFYTIQDSIGSVS